MDGRPSSTRTLVSTMSIPLSCRKALLRSPAKALHEVCRRLRTGCQGERSRSHRGQIHDLSVYFVLLRSTWDVLLINAIGDIRNVHCDQTNIGGQQ
jgi:hypothetical protein